jgi:thiamine-monophosphate kinase
MAIHEDVLIDYIRTRIPSSRRGLLPVGIGDDAAVVRPARGTEWVLTCDQFIEGVHFLDGVHPPDSVGFKALARATSDIAAMGARPRLFLLSLCLPASRTGRWLRRMLGGMARAARELGLTLVGGDTARGSTPKASTALSLTVLGEIKAGQAILRDGARPGDAIFVTGRLGAAQLGLELVLRRMHRQARFRRLLTAHYYPRIQVELGQWLVRRRLASAMMDLSDGLSTDLTRLCGASGVGALLNERQIPAVSVPKPLAKIFDASTLALHGGEDYGLLFTVPRRLTARIPRSIGGTRITRIGEIVAARGVKISGTDGRVTALAPGGWDHFKNPR